MLVGYSFGGLIVSQWLYKNKDRIIRHDPAFKALRGSCLIASPIRLRTTRVYYRLESHRTEETRGYVAALLEGYTAIPEHVPVIAPMVVFRCENDRLLDESAYTFQDLPLEDRPVEFPPIPNVRHQTIVSDEQLKIGLRKALLMLCTDSAGP